LSSRPPEDAGDSVDLYQQSFIEWDILEARGTPPARVWAVDHWLGMGHTTLLAAKGGMGKSILAQQLATAIALEQPFISSIPAARKVLAWMGEDDDDELWRRQDAICRKFKTSLGGLKGKLFLESMIDTDCRLMGKTMGGGLMRTHMLTTLREQIGDTKASVVILDNIAMLYAGSENDRSEVSAFMKAIAWAAKPCNAAVILIGHVAKGMNSEFSGSTAWENAVRSRWWLTDRPPDQDETEKDDAPTDLRYLAKRKVNYSSQDICILKYEDGAYDMMSDISQPTAGLLANIRKISGKRIVTTAMLQLAGKNLYGNESSNSTQYLPKMILQFNLNEGYTKTELAHAMRQLILDDAIVRAEIGQYQNRTPKFGLIIRPQ
jgi:RecA-family ATPase